MTPSRLLETPSWEWPPAARETIKAALRDPSADSAERTAAVEVAGDLVVMDDEMADLLLSILTNPRETEDLRARAAVAMGASVEEADIQGYGDDFSNPSISEDKFLRIRETLHSVYADESLGKELRRRALEASVRAPADWHREAILAAAGSGDEDWKLTAAFAMRWVPGFEDEILEMLESSNPEIYYEAIRAAGQQGVEGAWPHILGVLESGAPAKDLLIAALEAAPYVNRDEAIGAVSEFLDHQDEDISGAASMALSLAESESGMEEDDEDFFAEDDEEEQDDDR